MSTVTFHTSLNRPVFERGHVTEPTAQFNWVQSLVDRSEDRHEGHLSNADRQPDLLTLFEVLSRIPG
jgi:hypothetical protein